MSGDVMIDYDDVFYIWLTGNCFILLSGCSKVKYRFGLATNHHPEGSTNVFMIVGLRSMNAYSFSFNVTSTFCIQCWT